MKPIPIVALDVASAESALAIVDELAESCRFYKIGGELFTAAGPEVVRLVRLTGAEIFLDLKYHDIPNTVRGAVRVAARLGVRLLTVHAVGGSKMIGAAVDAARESTGCRVLAVTLLTSLAESEAADLWGRDSSFRAMDEVLRLANIAAEAGAAGVVCGGREARAVKDRFGENFVVLIPGIRLPGGAVQDQARVTTPGDAAAAGADFVVVGRTVTAAPDRRQAMRAVVEQISRAGADSASLA